MESENSNQQSVKYSVVVPVYNEEGNVKKLHDEILQEIKKLNEAFEIIFVNDGSTDKTLEEMKSCSPLVIVNFRKNFGQTAAMDAGIKQAKGELIITLDADLQNPPSEISKLLVKMKATDADVVSGWRKHRKDSPMKRFFSRGANFLRWILVHDGIHDSGCTLKIYKKECFDGVDLHGEMHRFIPAILKIKGFKVTEEVVDHRSRTIGKTKYSWTRAFKGFVDMISIWFWRKYSARPVHLFGILGIFMILASFIFAGIAFYRKIFHGSDLSDTAMTFFAGFFFLFGIQIFISGLLADIMIKNHYSVTHATSYNIKEVIRS